MKTIDEIRKELKSFESKLGFNPNDVGQGSLEWQTMKLGVGSASNADAFLAGKTTAKRLGYMAELVSQVATGIFPEINAKALSWGHDNEDAARSAYEFSTGEIVKEVPFIYKDESMRVGCSPDGKLLTKGLELKCPFSTRTFIEFLTSDKVKPEYIKQCQFSMWVTGADQWDFANYDPRMKKNMLHIITLDRDEKMMASFNDAVPQFMSEMDLMLKKIGIEFGEQWTRLIEEAA